VVNELQVQILRVCKQLLQDGRALLYGRNIIRISTFSGKSSFKQNVCEMCRLDLIGEQSRAVITKTELNTATPHWEGCLPLARGHHCLVLVRDHYPELNHVSWIQFTANKWDFRMGLEQMDPSSEFYWLEGHRAMDEDSRAIQKALTEDLTRTANDELINIMLLKAVASTEVAGMVFDKVYSTRTRPISVTGEVVIGVVLCDSTMAPISCPRMDTQHAVENVCGHVEWSSQFS